jgi:hypothetical protein
MTPNGRKIRRILITGFSIIIGVPLVVLVGLYALIGGFRDNVADDAAQPIGQAIGSLHGRQVCAAGDAGYGPDNTQPWYQAFYEVKDSPDIQPIVTAAARKQGYSLVELNDKALAKPPSQALYDKKSGRELNVTISRGKDAIATCNSGAESHAAAGNVIVFIGLTYPYRDTGSS